MDTVIPAGAETVSAGELYREALHLAGGEDYAGALQLLERARTLAPEHVGLYVTAAEILSTQLEDFGGASRLLDAAERIRPGAVTIALARAELEFQRGEFTLAEQGFRALLEHDRLGELARQGIARSLVAQGRQLMERLRYQQAGRTILQSLRYADTAAAHMNLGICQHALGNPQDSYREFHLSIEMDPANPVTYFQLATLLADFGEFAKAAAAYAQALSLDDGFPGARQRLAAAQARLGNLDAAVNLLLAELERDDESVECRHSLALAYVGLGRDDDALPHMQRVVAARPDDFAARYQLAGLLMSRGAVDQAVEHVRVLRAIDGELFREIWETDERFSSVRRRPEFSSSG